MINRIGEIAGKIYRTLETNGAMSVSKLKTEIGDNTFFTDAAIGWLARENKIALQKKGRSIIVRLV